MLNIRHCVVEIKTQSSLDVCNLTPYLTDLLHQTQINEGLITVSSRHTTTALTINEDEERLMEDLKAFLSRLTPKDVPYRHNDIELRDCPPDEPKNAHAHLAAMMLGSSEVVPVVDAKLALGAWQSVLLVELDGPRDRTVNVQLIGE